MMWDMESMLYYDRGAFSATDAAESRQIKIKSK